MAARIKAFFLVVAMAAAVELGMAANITVGAPGGSWDLKTNLTSWASGQTFTQGDNLIFSYAKSLHDVLEVNKADYDSCSTSNPMNTHQTGNDVIALPSAGKRYFICGTPTHCQLGMKVEIDTVAASTTPSPSPPAGSSPPPSSGTPSPPPSPTPPAGSSPPPSSSTPSPPSSPSPPGSSPPPPSSTPSSPGKSGANGHGLGAKTAVGFAFGLGMLMVLAL